MGQTDGDTRRRRTMPERPPSQDSAAWVAGAVTSPDEEVESGNRPATQLYRSRLEKPVSPAALGSARRDLHDWGVERGRKESR